MLSSPRSRPSRRSPRLRSLVLVPAALLALGLAGCSDDEGPSEPGDDTAPASGDSSVPGEPISQEAFLEQANQVCRDGNQALAAATADLADDLSPDDAEAIADFATNVYVPNIRQQLEDIRAIGFPPGEEDTIEGLLTDAEAALAEVETDPAAAFLGGTDPFAEVNPELEAYGLTECGSV
jgi:hypothetical protein